jgi:fucose permease
VNTNKEIGAIYSAGLVQGVVLVAFPAASTIITSPHAYNFSSTAYGSLFIPQALLSIAASALNPALCRKIGSKKVFLLGLTANLISMLLLALSWIAMKDQALSYPMLLIATGSLGLGFGLLVPTLNGMAALLKPEKIDSLLLMLNALLGVGTALAPLFISLFVVIGFWWGLPTLLVCSLIALLLYSYPLALPGGKITISSKSSLDIPERFWIFAAFALLYGIIETLNGNWVSIYMSKHLHADIKIQSMALTAFWGMVTFGRLFFSAIQKFFREQLAFQISPFISAAAFLIIAYLPQGAEYWAIAAFGLTGLGCSTLLPLIISFGSKQLKSIAASIPGMIISFYLLGYGIAAFGVGPLEEMAHLDLRMIYAIGALVAFILGLISLVIIQTKK